MIKSDPRQAETLAARAAEQLRDGATWVRRLREAGGMGSPVTEEALRHHALAYAWPTLLKMIGNGTIFSECRDLLGKAPVTPTDSEREVLQSSWDERHDLALATMELAWPRYLGDLITKWDEDGGAALTTYFVTGCKYRFPDAFRAWRRARRAFISALSLDESIPATEDPQAQVEQRDTLRRIVAKAPRETQLICQFYLRGYTLAEISAELGVSKGVVSTRMYRLGLKAWAMVDAGEIEAPPDATRPPSAGARRRRRRPGQVELRSTSRTAPADEPSGDPVALPLSQLTRKARS
ncbi:sigma-70 family RNA polymerase sigma factor [Nonomuraea aridisoli]|nr:sigma-70 family RNA polymerase sigma factor [Nonomuraea aridisoli]